MMPRAVCMPLLKAFSGLSGRLALGLVALLPLPLWGQAVYEQAGRHEVEVLDSVVFPARGAAPAVETRVLYPKGEGRFPVIAFSHGLGGNKHSFDEVVRHWASHGYIVIQPTHDDQGVGMTEAGMQPPQHKVDERLANIILPLNSLSWLASEVPALAERIDGEKLAVAGHSYGSFISLLAGGATVLRDDRQTSLAYQGLRCILPISPSGTGDYGFEDSSFDALGLPMMVVSGSRDQRNGRHEQWRHEPFFLAPPGRKFLLYIEGAAHGDFGGEVEGSAAPRYVKAASTAFFHGCLAGEPSAYGYLESPQGFEAFAGERAFVEEL